MPGGGICYRHLPAYKYQLTQDYVLSVPVRPETEIVTALIELSPAGTLRIRQGYAWDGPSGPTLDTRTFLRGSLVHDALYQLMRLGRLDGRTHRAAADALLRAICLEDGMAPWRAWYVHRSVRLFGAKNARPAPAPEDEILCAP